MEHFFYLSANTLGRQPFTNECGDGGVDLGCACASRRQMQSEAPHVLRLGRGRRAAKERGEVLDPLHLVMLGFRCELADRHVFDHAPTQRADGLFGHRDAPVLSEVVQTPRSQDRTHPSATL